MFLRWILGGAILAAGVVLSQTVIRRSVRARLMAKRIAAALGQCAPYPASD